MSKIFFITLLVLGVSIEASSENSLLRSLYDVVAPVVSGNPAPAQRQVGQIFYDVTAGAFKGVNKNGGIDILSGNTSNTLVKASATTPNTQALVYDPNTSYAPVIFIIEDYDIGNSYNETTGTFTAPVAGFYSIASQLYFGASSNPYADGDIGYINILKNGTDLFYTDQFHVKNTPTTLMALRTAGDFNLAAGDTLQVVVGVNRQNSSGSPIPFIFGWVNFKQIP